MIRYEHGQKAYSCNNVYIYIIAVKQLMLFARITNYIGLIFLDCLLTFEKTDTKTILSSHAI